MNFFGNKFKITLLLIFFFEILSLLGHYVAFFNVFGFTIAILTLMALILKDFRFGLYFLFAELFIGSFGRLFVIEIYGFSLSIRIAIWLIIILAWLTRSLCTFHKTKSCPNIEIIKSKQFRKFIPLFIFIIWGIINALLNHNSYANLINDANAWLYFALIIPVFFTYKASDLNSIMQVFTASVLALSFKTLFILYIFSHKINFMMADIYTWVRDTRIGEITSMKSGFTRIFIQSHIFILIATFVFFLLVNVLVIKNKNFWKNHVLTNKIVIFFVITSLMLAIDLINQSRSNWLGLIIGIVLCITFIIYYYGFKKMFTSLLILFTIFLFSFLIIGVIIKFPFPAPDSSFNTGSMLNERGKKIQSEAGISSRFALLPKLWSEIIKAPIMGEGFGTTVTYKSSDPRILEQDPAGIYTTFAFEWGWLDIWLKLGLLGFIAYLYLILYTIILFFKNIENVNILQIGFWIGLIVISAVSFFSPYMNHPLGISYLILTSVILFETKQKTS